MLAIAGLSLVASFLDAAGDDPWLRRGLWALVLVPFVDIVAVGLPAWLHERAQDDARRQVLAAAAPGSTVTIAPSTPVAGDFWVPPESWWRASLREDVARSVFGLGDIRFEPPFRDLEPSMELVLDAADAPHDLQLAKSWFRAAGVPELRATNLDWPERRGRPVLLARRRAGVALVPGSRHGGPITNGRYWLEPDVAPAADAEVWLVHDGVALSPRRSGARFELSPPQVGWYVLLVCDAAECWALDAVHARP